MLARCGALLEHRCARNNGRICVPSTYAYRGAIQLRFDWGVVSRGSGPSKIRLSFPSTGHHDDRRSMASVATARLYSGFAWFGSPCIVAGQADRNRCRLLGSSGRRDRIYDEAMPTFSSHLILASLSISSCRSIPFGGSRCSVWTKFEKKTTAA